MKTDSKRITVKGVALVLLFILIFCALFAVVQNILTNHDSRSNYLASAYEAPGTVDAAFMGTSHMNCALYPMELWDAYGFTSVNQAQSGQMPFVTYYAVQEVVERHHPKVVVVDLYYLYSETLLGNASFTHQTIDNMANLGVKLRCVTEVLPPSQWAEYLIPFTLYHGRWSELSKTDFSAPDLLTKGAVEIVTREYSGDDPVFEAVDVSDALEPSAVSLSWFAKIADYCKKQDTALVFVVVPYRAYGEEQRRDLADDQRYYNWMRSWCAENDVAFINMLDSLDDIGFDMKADMREWNHLNYFGGKKVSLWLGEKLAETYDLPDRRGDAAYAAWNENLTAYKADIEAQIAAMDAPDAGSDAMP